MRQLVATPLTARQAPTESAPAGALADALRRPVIGRFAFDGRSVVVTGGAQGIGKAIAERFASEGAKVFVADINAEGAQTAKRVGGATRVVRRASDANRMIEEVISRLGAVDVLCNDAGTITMRTTVDLEEDDWDMNTGTNAKGVFLGMRAVSDMDVAAFVAKTP